MVSVLCRPTDFVIETGLTGVVGPNGCGKSNLVEALRWAMGETSHKSLRAADMDAVIFAGSGNRPSAIHAEVVMTIDIPIVPRGGREDRETLESRADRARGGLGLSYQRPRRARPPTCRSCSPIATGARSPALVHQARWRDHPGKPEQSVAACWRTPPCRRAHCHSRSVRPAARTTLDPGEDVFGQLDGESLGHEARRHRRRLSTRDAVRFGLDESRQSCLVHQRRRNVHRWRIGEQDLHVAGAHVAAVIR